jgi:hypothetical protein
MVKKEQMKTPPKQSNHSKSIALNQSWTFLYLTHFSCSWWFFQKRGVFQQNQHSTFEVLFDSAGAPPLK